MGPICLFDKSFLQGLSLDEAVLFDHFFLPIVVPVFYAETLADLAKKPKGGHSSEQEVARIAAKFPEMNGSPCVFHEELVAADLMGYRVALTGQIPRAGGKQVIDGQTKAVVWELSPEAIAFERWTQGEFEETEKSSAQHWRAALTQLDVSAARESLRAAGIDPRKCKSEEECRAAAVTLTSDLSLKTNPIELLFMFLRPDEALRQAVLERHEALGRPRLSAFAPYAAYVLRVEAFFQVAVAAGLLGVDPNNRMDIAYLFYLPFCMVFTSSDNLHRRLAPLFIREDQSFVWGFDLKKDLAELNTYYSVFPDDVKERGLMSFARYPPTAPDFLVAELFDRHMKKGWRDLSAAPAKEEGATELPALMKRLMEGRAVTEEPVDTFTPEAVVVTKKVRKKRGSWFQLPADLEMGEGDEATQ